MIAVSQGSPQTNDPVGFDGGASSDPDPGDTPLSYAWSFDDGGAASGPGVAHAFATAGVHTATLTVTDPAGVSASTSRAVEIHAPPGGSLLPPVISIRSFTAATKRKRVIAFRYALSGAGKSVRITVEALLPGKRSGSRCVAPSRRLRRARGCTRIVSKGSLTGPATAGANTLAFAGKVKGKSLPPGSYRATIRATDRFDRLSNTKRLTFAVPRSS
jgi:hypothetical protein